MNILQKLKHPAEPGVFGFVREASRLFTRRPHSYIFLASKNYQQSGHYGDLLSVSSLAFSLSLVMEK